MYCTVQYSYCLLKIKELVVNKLQVDVYRNPHKELRKGMFELSLRAAQATQDAEIAEVIQLAGEVFKRLHHHAHAEETYLHPIIRPNMLELLDNLEVDHHAQDAQLAHLQETLVQLSLEQGSEARTLLMQEFYSALNQFIGHYLVHLAQEEKMLPLLWQRCQPHELFAVMAAFKCLQEPDQFPHIMAIIKQNLDECEMAAMFSVMRQRLGEFIFARVFKAACALNDGVRPSI